MRRATGSRYARPSGFTLIEMMITVVIVGVLAAIAIPSYNEFVIRGRLTDAHAKLGDLRGQMERYFLDNRTYRDTTDALCGIDDAAINMTATYNADNARSFDVTCAAPTPTTYILTATGRAARGMGGFIFTVDQANARTSIGPAPWPTVAVPCWFVRKDGDCS